MQCILVAVTDPPCQFLLFTTCPFSMSTSSVLWPNEFNQGHLSECEYETIHWSLMGKAVDAYLRIMMPLFQIPSVARMGRTTFVPFSSIITTVRPNLVQTTAAMWVHAWNGYVTALYNLPISVYPGSFSSVSWAFKCVAKMSCLRLSTQLVPILSILNRQESLHSPPWPSA